MKINGIVETAIHVENVAESAEFYRRLFGLDQLAGDDRFCALAVPGHAVFLLFKKGGTLEPVPTPGGLIPPHDGDGHMHMAFAIPSGSADDWVKRLEACAVPVESRVEWDSGGTSLFFRDPDGHLIELATPGTWTIY